jgi:dTDP-glucose pyrophosphorylase
MMADAEYYESRAVRELASELKNHEGGAIPQYDVQEPATFGVGHLEGVI